MAQEELASASTQETTPEMLAAKVTATLNGAIASGELTLDVEGHGTRTIRSGEASNVVVRDVWAFFTLGIYAYRTASSADRDALLSGKAAIRCVQIRGPKSETAESEPERVKGFVPRSGWGRTAQNAHIV